MRWESIVSALSDPADGQPGLWDEPPATGTLPQRHVGRLAEILAEYTQTRDRCWFAIWEGFGDLPYLGSLRPPRLLVPAAT